MTSVNVDTTVMSVRDPPCPCRASTVDFTIIEGNDAGLDVIEWHCKGCPVKWSIDLV